MTSVLRKECSVHGTTVHLDGQCVKCTAINREEDQKFLDNFWSNLNTEEKMGYLALELQKINRKINGTD